MIPTDQGPLAPEQIIDYLDYSCYRHNREGGMSAEQLASKYLFGPERGAALERRYQDTINAYVERGIRREQRERHEGRPEHDLDVAGRPLKAGS